MRWILTIQIVLVPFALIRYRHLYVTILQPFVFTFYKKKQVKVIPLYKGGICGLNRCEWSIKNSVITSYGSFIVNMNMKYKF